MEWITGDVADKIRYMTSERSLIIAGHMDHSDGGTSIGDLNSVAGSDLGGAVHPEEREVLSRGGAGQADGTAELQQVRAAHGDRHIGDWDCGQRAKQPSVCIYKHADGKWFTLRYTCKQRSVLTKLLNTNTKVELPC